MTRHLLAEIAVAAIVLALLAFFVGLLLAAQTVGVEAWHDSALPASAFVAVQLERGLTPAAGVTTGPTRNGTPPRTQAGFDKASATPAISKAPSVAALTGIASTYGPGFDGYLALPSGRGIHVRICGAGGCIDRVSNDTGPVPSLHRVADLDVADFEKVCGVPWTRGLCRVSVEVVAPAEAPKGEGE